MLMTPLPSNRPATPLFSPACWEPGFQAWAQSTCPELSAQGLVPLRWGCALPSPNAPGRLSKLQELVMDREVWHAALH